MSLSADRNKTNDGATLPLSARLVAKSLCGPQHPRRFAATSDPYPTRPGDRLSFLTQLGVRLFDFEVRCQALQRPHQ
jgi:hypothetical protein